MSTPTISKKRAADYTKREILAAQRAGAQLPLTFLGTGGRPEGQQGWQGHMWLHPLYGSGLVFAVGQAVNQAVESGILPSPVPFVPDGIFTAVCAGAAGLLSGVAGLMATAGERFSDWSRAYFTFGPMVAGAYLSMVSVTSPYSTASLTAAATGTAVSMGMYWRMRQEQDAHELAYVRRWTYPSTQGQAETPAEPPPAAPLVLPEKDPEAVKWEAAFTRVGLKGCQVLKRVDTPAGYAILVGFPDTGNIGGEQVAIKLPNIERSLGLLKDCLEYDTAVNRDGRELADRCWVHVDVANILEQLLDMPDDDEAHEPTSVNDFFRIGTFIDGTPMLLRFREISALIVGVRGRGKTNLFHVLVHQLSRCVDVVLWAIDLKGGRAVKPWLKPWLDVRVARPVFDWVATTRFEASLMIHAAEALINFRGNRSAGGSKITPSRSQPGVIVLVDEVAALVGKHAGPKSPDRTDRWWANPTASQLAAVLTLCIQLGRSEAVDFVLCTQRATVTMTGGGDLKSQCEMRIGLGVTNPSDASSVFQNNNVNARKLTRLKNKKTRGACLIENGDDPKHLCGKTFYYGDDAVMLRRIDRTATLHALIPASLPELEQQAIDDALLALTNGECGYGVGDEQAADQRWSMARAEHLYTEDLDPDWVDDDPGDGESLGGQADAGDQAPARRGSATATMVRPRSVAPPARQTSAPPAASSSPWAAAGSAPGSTRPGPSAPTYNRTAAPPAPTSPAGPPVSPAPAGPPAGNKYYVRRDQRAPGQPATAPDQSQRNPEAERYQQEFDALVRTFHQAPEAAEPDYDTSDPEQLTRYEVMLEVIKEAGTVGLMAGSIMAEMVARGRAWANRQELHPALNRAKDVDKVIVQPRERGKYYWHEFAPKRPS
jgi:hypothetical protein